MRSRRRRSRFEKVIPKPELVIEVNEAPSGSVSVGDLEPSRARPREAYVPVDADNEVVERVARELLDAVEVDYEIRFEHAEYQRVFVDVDEEMAGSLIGKRGSGLESIELLMGRMASHQVGHAVPVQVDVNEYRHGREQDLREDALAAAERVKRTGRLEEFPPLSARDRRVVHLAIQELEGFETYSVGHGGAKTVVIRRAEGADGASNAQQNQ